MYNCTEIRQVGGWEFRNISNQLNPLLWISTHFSPDSYLCVGETLCLVSLPPSLPPPWQNWFVVTDRLPTLAWAADTRTPLSHSPAWTQSALLSSSSSSCQSVSQSHSQPCRRNREDQRTWPGTLDSHTHIVVWPPPYHCLLNSFTACNSRNTYVSDFQRCSRGNKDAFITIVVVGIGVAFLMWSAIICYICYSRKLYARYQAHYIHNITSATDMVGYEGVHVNVSARGKTWRKHRQRFPRQQKVQWMSPPTLWSPSSGAPRGYSAGPCQPSPRRAAWWPLASPGWSRRRDMRAILRPMRSLRPTKLQQSSPVL